MRSAASRRTGDDPLRHIYQRIAWRVSRRPPGHFLVADDVIDVLQGRRKRPDVAAIIVEEAREHGLVDDGGDH